MMRGCYAGSGRQLKPDQTQNLGIWQKVEITLNLKIRVVFSTDF